VFITVVAVAIIVAIVESLLRANMRLGYWIMEGKGNPFLKVLSLPLWLVLGTFSLICHIIAAIAAIDLAKSLRSKK